MNKTNVLIPLILYRVKDIKSFSKVESKMKILSIGNSLSQDAQPYLHRLAKKAGGEEHEIVIKAVNMAFSA